MLCLYCLLISVLIPRISSDTFLLEDMPVTLTCYTCSEVSSNDNCDQFALDHPCPEGTKFCQTIHVMNSTGSTISVTKRCASECTASQVGCIPRDSNDGQICVSCCDQMYCNDFVPTNKSTAILQQTKGGNVTSQSSLSLKSVILLTMIMWSLQKQ